MPLWRAVSGLASGRGDNSGMKNSSINPWVFTLPLFNAAAVRTESLPRTMDFKARPTSNALTESFLFPTFERHRLLYHQSLRRFFVTISSSGLSQHYTNPPRTMAHLRHLRQNPRSNLAFPYRDNTSAIWHPLGCVTYASIMASTLMRCQ